jgi:hypothetical protein
MDTVGWTEWGGVSVSAKCQCSGASQGAVSAKCQCTGVSQVSSVLISQVSVFRCQPSVSISPSVSVSQVSVSAKCQCQPRGECVGYSVQVTVYMSQCSCGSGRVS